MRYLILILISLLVTGCSLWGKATSQDDVVITHTCGVNIAEAAAVTGVDDSDTMLYVEVKPDCTTMISTEQIEGDSVIKIEEQRTRPGSMPMAVPEPEMPEGQ
jgi:hypothetical protein